VIADAGEGTSSTTRLSGGPNRLHRTARMPYTSPGRDPAPPDRRLELQDAEPREGLAHPGLKRPRRFRLGTMRMKSERRKSMKGGDASTVCRTSSRFTPWRRRSGRRSDGRGRARSVDEEVLAIAQLVGRHVAVVVRERQHPNATCRDSSRMT